MFILFFFSFKERLILGLSPNVLICFSDFSLKTFLTFSSSCVIINQFRRDQTGFDCKLNCSLVHNRIVKGHQMQVFE